MPGRPEWILAGGTVLNGGHRRCEALAIGQGRVVAAGTLRQMRLLAGPATRELDLAGGTVIPGLVDSHCHLLAYGLSLRRLPAGLCGSLDALLLAVAERASLQPPGTWVEGWGWNEERWPGRCLPGRAELDRVAPAHPVLLRRVCGHVAAANSMALRLAGIGPGSADPPGGTIQREAGGEPTGVLYETAVALVERAIPAPAPAELQHGLERAGRAALSLGITAVHSEDARSTGGAAACLNIYRQVVGEARLPLRAYLHIYQSFLAELQELGLRTGDGDAWVRVGAIKLFADGSLGGRTAALRQPYADDPTNCGLLIHPAGELAALTAAAHAAGYQVAVHAIGDAAAEAALDAMAAANRRRPRSGARHRLIHCQVLDPRLIRRMRTLGVVADIQPRFLSGDGHWYQRRLGASRTRWAYAWRSLLRAGVPCCGGSDCPVEPLNPFFGLFAAVTRQDLDGTPPGGWQPAERLSVAEALDLFTRGAAYAAFAEAESGQLAPGQWADLAVLDRDPTRVDPGELPQIRVLRTMVGGRVAFEA